MRKTLVIFTHGAPFCNIENAFLMPELPMLSQRFERVVLVPDRICHRPDFSQPADLPDNVTVYKADDLHPPSAAQSQLRGLFTFAWARDLFRYRGLSQLKAGLSYANEVRLFKTMFRKLVYDLNLHTEETLFYSFWMTHEASGLAELSLKNKDLHFVSRAHGYDLYDYRINFRSRYYRELTINQSNGIFCCSKDGASHLETRYSCRPGKIKVAYLGVDCDGVVPAPFNGVECVLRLITVASLLPVKQHVRFINSLVEYAREKAYLNILYDIIGDGYCRQQVEAACGNIPKNLSVKLYGALSNKDLLEHYYSTPYDLFVLPSQSEGVSVAVMEAMARGIPALVTDVGGMSELVRDGETGYLIPKNFTGSDIAKAFEKHLNSYAVISRDAVRQDIVNRFNRRVVRQAFVKELADIGKIES